MLAREPMATRSETAHALAADLGAVFFVEASAHAYDIAVDPGGRFEEHVATHRGNIASLTTAALPAATAQQLDPRALARLREGNFDLLQLDATAYPGNSGGPLLDAETGRVLGIVNMVLVKAGRESALSNPTGITYAVPVRHLHELLKSTKP